MITKLDRATVHDLQEELKAAMKVVTDRHGLSLIFKSQVFNASSTQLKYEVAVRDASGAAQSRERQAFQLMAVSYGHQSSDLDRTFTSRGRTFTICGLKTRSSYPVLAKRDDGTVFKFTVETVRMALPPRS